MRGWNAHIAAAQGVECNVSTAALYARRGRALRSSTGRLAAAQHCEEAKRSFSSLRADTESSEWEFDPTFPFCMKNGVFVVDLLWPHKSKEFIGLVFEV